MKDKSGLQIIRQTTERPPLQKLPRHRWPFFVGIGASCVGEAMFIGYALFWHDSISDIGFTAALALLVSGNVAILVENKLRNLTMRISRN